MGIYYIYIRDFPATSRKRGSLDKEAHIRLFYLFNILTIKSTYLAIKTFIAENSCLTQHRSFVYPFMHERYIPGTFSFLGGSGDTKKTKTTEFFDQDDRTSKIFTFPANLYPNILPNRTPPKISLRGQWWLVFMLVNFLFNSDPLKELLHP